VISNYIGFYALLFGLVISFILIVKSILFLKNKNKVDNFFSLLSSQFILTVISFLSLIYSFVNSDFSNNTVFNHSHTSKPLFYKISGTWGNHEGSLLLWLLVLTFFIMIFFIKSGNLKLTYRVLTIFFQQIIILGFYLFIIFTSNPFGVLYPVPVQGLGLNPILQDPLLAIHPPVLYLGYVGSSIIFSSSLATLVTNTMDNEWAKHIKKWIFTSWIFLTLGIMLGSIWAYYELGWGGFWFWDPVENVSLMPWFCLTALIHTISVLEKRNMLQSWTFILSIMTFTLSMSGTFLVRSGILNSIHTFANDPSRGLFILVFLFSLILLSIFIFFVYYENIKVKEIQFKFISKETSILFNNWFLMYFLSVVLVGTVYPIFLEAFTNEKISVGEPFYQKLITPFMVPFLIFMAFAPNISWIKQKAKIFNIKILILFLLNLILAFYIVRLTDTKYLFSTILITSALFLFLISLKDFINSNSLISQRISHLAFSILILSILFNGILAKEYNSNMGVGDEVKFFNGTIKFLKISINKENNYQNIKGTFEYKNLQNKDILFEPEIRVYDQPNISTSEADIKTNFFTDNILNFNLLKDEEYFSVRYQYKPLMFWVWISTFFLAFGGVLSFFRK
jgi:cytochrome c-type biogenesis protein CcmF